MRKILNVIILLVLLPFSMQCMASLQSFVYGSLSYGSVDGFIQTPRGGSFGTTSYRRPTLDELNIHKDNFFTLGAGFILNDYAATFNYNHFSPHGETLLSQNLITHSNLINAGDTFNSELDLELFSFGFGKSFYFYDYWVLTPLLIVNYLKYHYEFDSPLCNSSRTFNVVGLDAGFKAQYFFTTAFSADVQAAFPIPGFNFTAGSIDVGINMAFSVSNHMSIIPRLAVGMLRMDYKDNQEIPNHIRYTNAPFGTFGVILHFH